MEVNAIEEERCSSPTVTQQLLQSIATNVIAPITGSIPQQQQLQRDPSQQISRGRFVVTQCTGICTLIITCFVILLIFLSKNDGVNETLTDILRIWKEIFVNKTTNNII